MKIFQSYFTQCKHEMDTDFEAQTKGERGVNKTISLQFEMN